jgi:hypothetical protein
MAEGCSQESPEAAPEEPPAWDANVRDILVRYCSGCHGSSGCIIDGTCFLDQYTLMPSPTLQMWQCEGMTFSECTIYTIQIGLMPPGGCLPGQEKCITNDEFETVKQWVENGSPES